LKKYGRTIEADVKAGRLADDYKWMYNAETLASEQNMLKKTIDASKNLSKLYMVLT